MNNKIMGILICTLLIATTVLPVTGTIKKDEVETSDSGSFLDHDMELTIITSPVNGTVCGEIIPQVIVTNLGSQYENVAINITIEKLSGGTNLEYSQVSYENFDPYQTKVISFAAWPPNDWQVSENVDIVYRVCACVTLIGATDPDLSNNCKCIDIKLHFPYFHDVGVETIDSPNGCVSSLTSPVIVTIKNYGQFAETGFIVHVEIDNGTTTIYSDDVVVGGIIQPCDMLTLTFPDIAFESSGIYTVTACTQLDVDTNPSNDCLTITINVDLTRPDLIIYDRSSGTFNLIGDDIYEQPNWPTVTQIGKWALQWSGPINQWYWCRIKLQNDGTANLVGHTIETVLISGVTGTKGKLFYKNTASIFTYITLGASTTAGAQISGGGGFRWLFLIVRTPHSGVSSLQVGIHVKSTSCSEDSVIFKPYP